LNDTVGHMRNSQNALTDECEKHAMAMIVSMHDVSVIRARAVC